MTAPGTRPVIDPQTVDSDPAPPPASTDQPQRIGRYRIEKILGEGGFGRVYLAHDDQLDRPVAIKVPRRERLSVPGDAEAYLAEARVVAGLDHPNIVPVHDVGTTADGMCYVVSKLIEGSDLAARIRETRLSPTQAAELVATVAEALHYAHRKHLVHRDIKPGNILLSKTGDTKVSDFGASFQQRHGHETTQISGVGSPAYMSPEQIRMEDVTHQTDIYSLGVVMYRLLTGRMPFEASTQAGLSYAILNTPPPRPATLRPDLPPLLDQIVMKAIEKDQAERYQTWLEFGKDLSQAFTALRLAGDSVSDSEKFTQLRDMPFFEDFDDVALWEVVRIGSWKMIEAGTVIIREADQGDSFYLLIDGEVGVTLLGKPLNTIKPGGCFGEILYFSNRTARRTTTITATTKVTVMEIRADALRAATDACQVGFNKAFMRVLVDRLTQANLRLAGRG
jgi:eukaryotic-like serine/threonine-protein kinase